MKLSTANIIHALAVAGQVLNSVSGIVPPKYQPIIAGLLAAGQLIVGKLQQNTPVPVPVPSAGGK